MRSKRGRRVALFAGAVLASVVPLPMSDGDADDEASAATTILPAGFVNEPILGGLNIPTSVTFASDGSVFVAEKAGLIKRFDNMADTTPTVVADLRAKVSLFGDRGLMGFQVDPGFPGVPTAYVIYGARGKVTDTIPSSTSCTSDPCIESGMLSRLDWNGSAFVETELVHDWCQIFFSHSVDDVAIMPDGSVFASAGDSAVTGFYDNRCPGEPVGESGSLRPQDIRTSGDPIGYTGTVIRVDANGNPVLGSTPEDRIVGAGFRNPFRISYSTQTGLLFVADVGEDRTESIDVVVPSTFANHGWPCYEASRTGPGAFTPICDALPLSQTKSALFTYEHAATDIASDDAGRCPKTTGGNSTSGLTHYRGTGTNAFPSTYTNALFFSDYARECIWYMAAGPDGMPDPTQVHHFTSDIGGIIDLEQAPDGSLVYIDIMTGSVRRIRYTASGGGNQAPVISSVTASPQAGPAPLATTLSAVATDPENEALTYTWDTDGDGVYESSGQSIAVTYSNPGARTATVRVSDASGGSVTQSIVVTAVGPDTLVIGAPTNWSATRST